MSDHYCCKHCGLHYYECRCQPLEPAPSVPLTFIQERAQLDQEWSVLDAMKAAYKPTTPQSASVFGGSYQADGYIVSRFTTTAGAERVVFEFNEPKGMLHIFTPEQIEVKP
jgi:hypothetical protein